MEGVFPARAEKAEIERTIKKVFSHNPFFRLCFQTTKESPNIKYDNPLREYLNWRVILAYVMFFGILLLNTWCYTKVDMRYGPVIDTAAYVFVLLLSRFILNEKITKGKLIGNLIIIAGILVYTL